ncbi:MAG: peptidylprolyl isomerase [Candidatus Baltobacteraceae bacterium]
MKTPRFAFLALLLALLGLAGLRLPAPAATPPSDVRVKIVTQQGDIIVALDSKRAPKTVANFLHYVDGKFYDGGTFFRAVPGFVIQGGNQPRERPGDQPIPLEGPLSTGIRNKDGAISMARTSDPNSATSEFFICDGDQPALDGSNTAPGYAAFGHVVSGMNVVRAIAHAPAQDEHLLEPVKIVKIVRLH